MALVHLKYWRHIFVSFAYFHWQSNFHFSLEWISNFSPKREEILPKRIFSLCFSGFTKKQKWGCYLFWVFHIYITVKASIVPDWMGKCSVIHLHRASKVQECYISIKPHWFYCFSGIAPLSCCEGESLHYIVSSVCFAEVVLNSSFDFYASFCAKIRNLTMHLMSLGNILLLNTLFQT